MSDSSQIKFDPQTLVGQVPPAALSYLREQPFIRQDGTVIVGHSAGAWGALALAGGGYGVDVVTSKTSHLTGVTTGLYSDTLVQVSGSGLTAGTLVEVPSS